MVASLSLRPIGSRLFSTPIATHTNGFPRTPAHPIVHVNASLNFVATILLVIGLWLIKRGRVEAHKRTMLAAFAVSAAFLGGYVWYHVVLKVAAFASRTRALSATCTLRFLFRTSLLAITVPPLAIRQMYLGFRALGCCPPRRSSRRTTVACRRLSRKHIRLARWTFPIWLYVSVTGVIVYVMLYHLWPPAGE